MTFVNGVALAEVTTRDAVEPGSFFYDQTTRELYLGTDPTGNLVELAARPMAIALEAGNTFSIRGIGFTRFATNEFNGNRTHGALLVNSPNVTLDRLAFTRNAAAGVIIADPTNARVTNSYFGQNGYNGLDANGHSRTGATDNLVLETNMFDGNNTERFGTGCDVSCGASGSKMAHIVGLTLKGNVFQNGVGVGHGYWCDLDCQNVSVTSVNRAG